MKRTKMGARHPGENGNARADDHGMAVTVVVIHD
jgi:hypothetical protein